MELKKLLLGIENFKSKGDMQLDIKKVASNSKKVVPNSLFVAIKGYDFDGHEYIEEAVKNGAVAVMLDMSADFKKINIPKGITVIITDDTRKALGDLERYRKVINERYSIYLDEKYMDLLNKKMDVIERELKNNLFYKDYIEQEQTLDNEHRKGR